MYVVVYTNSKNQKANKGICIWHYPHALKTGKSYGFFKSSTINNKVEHTSGQKMGKIVLIDFLSTISY